MRERTKRKGSRQHRRVSPLIILNDGGRVGTTQPEGDEQRGEVAEKMSEDHQPVRVAGENLQIRRVGSESEDRREKEHEQCQSTDRFRQLLQREENEHGRGENQSDEGDDRQTSRRHRTTVTEQTGEDIPSGRDQGNQTDQGGEHRHTGTDKQKDLFLDLHPRSEKSVKCRGALSPLLTEERERMTFFLITSNAHRLGQLNT